MAAFDAGGVYYLDNYSTQQNIDDRDESLLTGNYNSTKKSLKEFLRQFHDSKFVFIYRDGLKRSCNLRQYFLQVNVQDLSRFNAELGQAAVQQPTELLPIFEDAATEVADEITRPRPQGEESLPLIQVTLVSEAHPVAMRDLKSDLVCKLVRLSGIVISASSVRSKATHLTLQCRTCRTCLSNLSVKPGLEGYVLPRKCPTDAAGQGRPKCPLDPFFIVPDKCRCVDYQLLKIQETPESIPHGEMPRHIQVYCDRYLCDRVSPGNRVSIVGIFSIRGQGPSSRGKGSSAPGVRAAYVRALGLELEENSHGLSARLSEEEESEFRRLASLPDIYERLAKSIAPSIFGATDMKKAICCLLFGGSRKRLPDGLCRRGDINLLLLGDPGTAKSQLLKFVEKCAPIAVYTSGKGSSAAGLTAAVVRDPSSRNFVMEGGAMVLADGGVVCIDEFDKMREDDRVAIHEAMEQQTISIAKAGITTTLNSRCSVLAAANSVLGRWDDTRSAGENIDFMPTILSRFDMIFIVKDEHDESRDSQMARHVLRVHLSGALAVQPPTVDGDIPLEKFRRFIGFCRSKCGPRLNERAANMLKNAYVMMRNGAASMEQAANQSAKGSVSGKQRSVIPITVRQLEAVVRIAESLAKMRMAPFATESDIEEALRLFKVSTLDAASTGNLSGAEGFATEQDHDQLIQAERQVKRRFLIGSQVSEAAIISDFSRQGFQETVIQKVLSLMLRRGEIQYRMQRRVLYRLK